MNLKRNIIKFLLLGICVSPIAFTSCSEDAMDEVNTNVNNPVDVPAKFILADVLTKTAFSNVGGDINTYVSTYVEHEAGTHNQLWNAEHRINEPSKSSTFDNSWSAIYETLRNTKIIMEKCAVGGTQEGNNTTLAIGQIMTAYNLALLTDMFGDVPYSEAFNPLTNKTPKLDKQEDLYKLIFQLLDEAIVNLPKGDKHPSGSSASHDLLFAGNVAKWTKFAHGLKARYTLRLLNVSTDKTAALNTVLDEVALSFTSADEEAAFNIYGAQNLNPLFDFQWSRDGLAASRSLADKFIERNDPRLVRNFIDADWNQIVDIATGNASYELLAENGENDQVQYHYLTSAFVFAQTASTQLLSYHELLFIKAEAMARLNQSPADIEDVLKEAVIAGLVNSEKSVAAAMSAPTVAAYGGLTEVSDAITSAAMNDYFDNSVLPLFQANALKEIANQKYLAFSGASGETPEIYNDIRRWKVLGENPIELKNTNDFPIRLPYGSSETTTNPNVQAAYGNGQYVYSDNVWWAGGNR